MGCRTEGFTTDSDGVQFNRKREWGLRKHQIDRRGTKMLGQMMKMPLLMI
jgi:hypothetical protein